MGQKTLRPSAVCRLRPPRRCGFIARSIGAPSPLTEFFPPDPPFSSFLEPMATNQRENETARWRSMRGDMEIDRQFLIDWMKTPNQLIGSCWCWTNAPASSSKISTTTTKKMKRKITAKWFIPMNPAAACGLNWWRRRWRRWFVSFYNGGYSSCVDGQCGFFVVVVVVVV